MAKPCGSSLVNYKIYASLHQTFTIELMHRRCETWTALLRHDSSEGQNFLPLIIFNTQTF